MITGWNDVEEPRATKSQRACLYRLGYARHLVHQLTRDEASTAIAEGIARKGRIEAGKQQLRHEGQDRLMTDVLC